MLRHNSLPVPFSFNRALPAAILAFALLAACARGPADNYGATAAGNPAFPDRLVLKRVRYDHLAGWAADDQKEAFGAFLKSCQAFERAPDTGANGPGLLLAPVAVWKTACRKAEWTPLHDNAEARAFFEQEFVPFKAFNNDDPTGLFTGYFEPILSGSRVQRRPYMFPVYGVPAPGATAYTRQQIDLGMLSHEAPVLAYVDDPVALFFMQVQGSGRIRFEDKQILHVGYAGRNGYPYVSIGQVLVDKGILQKKDVSMPTLVHWLHDHPGDMWPVMWRNPSYIFFRVLGEDALGAEQVPLTPFRSLAVDPAYIPLGLPVFIDTMLPPTPQSTPEITRRLMIAQDSGAAIRGPMRFDIFFGSGDLAEQLAGSMRSGGQAVFLVPKALGGALEAEGK